MFLPEFTDLLSHALNRAYFPASPFTREKSGIGRSQQALVQKQYDAEIFRRADHSPGGLFHFVDAGKAVGIIEAIAAVVIRISLSLET